MTNNKHYNIRIVAICEDPEGGWDITASVNGKTIYFWSNYSCTELQIVSSSFIFVKSRDKVRKILDTVFHLWEENVYVPKDLVI